MATKSGYVLKTGRAVVPDDVHHVSAMTIQHKKGEKTPYIRSNPYGTRVFVMLYMRNWVRARAMTQGISIVRFPML